MAAHIQGPLYYERAGRTGPVMAFVHPNPMDQSCDAEFERIAKSFEKADWPEITWHSYSVRWGQAEKGPRYADLDRRAYAAQSISVPELMINGGSDLVTFPELSAGKDRFFVGGYERHVIRLSPIFRLAKQPMP